MGTIHLQFYVSAGREGPLRAGEKGPITAGEKGQTRLSLDCVTCQDPALRVRFPA